MLRIDLNTERYAEQGTLDDVLETLLMRWESEYGVTDIMATFSQRFKNVIRTAHEVSGRPVVILVDEYDKPLVSNLNDDCRFEHYQKQLAAFYSNFKSSAEHIKLVFLTGVSRFSKLSIFSDLNNLNDITFDNAFADICGITERELMQNFRPGIMSLAEENDISCDEALRQLKKSYDGYRFTKKGSDIYNPWSVLNCLQKREISNYWSQTGKPTLIAEAIYRFDTDIRDLFNTQCDESTLQGLDLRSSSPLAMLLQTGYLTIKDYDRETQLYTLGIPNREVTDSLFKELLPLYVRVRSGGEV